MYENYSAPLPDADAYLERIGIGRRADPDRAFLDSLIYAHQTHIPFEDLDCWKYKKPISLEIPALFDKIVVKKRGGFCFELNRLFGQALNDLGFRAYTVFCRILYLKDELPPCTHCANIVYLEGRPYFCDVGFGGPQPPYAVPVTDEPEAVHGDSGIQRASAAAHSDPGTLANVFRTRRIDDIWFTLSRTNAKGEEEDILQFSLIPQTPQEFIPACRFCSEGRDAVFAKTLMAGLLTENGSLNITDNVFTEREGCDISRTVLETWEEQAAVLREKFGIRLPE